MKNSKTSKLRCFILLSLSLLCTTLNPNNAFSQTLSDAELYPVRVNGKEGYIDATGRMVIKPQYEKALYFSEGLAGVEIGDKSGYVDKAGRIVITPQFDGLGSFSEGLADVSKGGRRGYVDKTGKMVINPQFDVAFSFSEGLARVWIGDMTGYIDKTGRYVIGPRFDQFLSHDFSDGLASVVEGNDWYTGKHGFIDKSGRWFFNYSFRHADAFSEGLAYVGIGNQDGFIDKTGRFVIYTQEGSGDYNYNYYSFKEGMSRFSKTKYENVSGVDHLVLTEETIGFIDKAGRCVISPQFHDASDFSEGLACVRIGGKYGKGRYGFVDKNGSYVINPQYDYAESFRGGIAPVVINNQFQYINKKGEIVWSSSELPSYISWGIENLIDSENLDYYKYRK